VKSKRVVWPATVVTSTAMPKPYEILTGDCFRLVKRLPARSVHCIVTSPPYFGLRDYETKPRVWGGKRKCPHSWGPTLPGHHDGQVEQTKWQTAKAAGAGGRASAGAFCRHCGAWRGSFGLEPTHDLYVAHLVLLFRRLWRVLRDDGVVWLNLGDSYNNYRVGNAGGMPANTVHKHQRHGQPDFEIGCPRRANRQPGLKNKDLCGIPWRVALALQAAGWYLRSDVVWAKGVSFCPAYSGTSMPESTRDRPSRTHEYLFLLTKQPHYFYDQLAASEATVQPERMRADRVSGNKYVAGIKHSDGSVFTGATRRNLRSVWAINPHPFRGAHFAVFPQALVEPCIKAGTSEHGCCPKCGAPWERIIKRHNPSKWAADPEHTRNWANTHQKTSNPQSSQSLRRQDGAVYSTARMLGWRPTCKCGKRRTPVPCTVLDPFNGSGTTGAAAVQLHRRYLGIELNPTYVRMAQRRLRRAARSARAQLSPLFGDA
jgi:DNA modification methylase